VSLLRGPKGCRVLVEPAGDTPLAWVTVTALGGAAADPEGKEGMARHMAELARRGTVTRDRGAVDDAVDCLGASLDVSTQRDSVSLSSTVLSRHLDELIELFAEILAKPAMRQDEHDKLLRETRNSLDDVRDDDSLLATRYFDRYCAPGHPYGRTARGTEASLAALDLDEIKQAFRALCVPANLILGFGGDIDEARARALAERLVAELPDTAAPALPDVSAPAEPELRRIYVIDKPERTQTQISLGHLGPRYGTDDAVALTVVETAFGGTFTSRLMQEIRVKRGWSYGASCRLYRARGPQWFRISLAPSAEVTADALELTLSLYEELASGGLTDEELAFAKSYLEGSIPFVLATPRQRLNVAISDQVFGLPEHYIHLEAEKLRQVDLAQTREVLRRWAMPQRACIVLVATADSMVPRLEARGFGPVEVIPYDAY
jgi:zinc protease